MEEEHRNAVLVLLIAALRWMSRYARGRRSHPPVVGVREPRRPKPTLPAAAIALDEPRTEIRHRLRLAEPPAGTAAVPARRRHA
jgi:Na+-transporting methylmalonyl-CoA/oxaloacetate decarboxylase gamma subunit